MSKKPECPGADDPEERCPRHPKDCKCWQVDLSHPTVSSMTTYQPKQKREGDAA